MADPYASSTVSSILAWILSFPILWTIVMAALALPIQLVKEDSGKRVLGFWILLCIFVLSPFRYILFTIVLWTSYPVQSVGALGATIGLALYVPFIVAFVLGLIMMPISLAVSIADKPGAGRQLATAALTPVTCLLASLLFAPALPYIGKAFHWLDDRDVIRATNGPAQLVYTTLLHNTYPIALPSHEFMKGTPGTVKDDLRCHVALVYLGAKEANQFVSKQYPKLAEEPSP